MVSILHPYFPNVDPERKWLFRLEFGSVPGYGGNAMDILAINARQVTIPSYQITPIIVPHMNHDVKVAGRPTLPDMTVTFQNAYNYDAIEVLENWGQYVYDGESEQMGYAEEYKIDGLLLVYDTKQYVRKTYQLKGCFPLNIGDKDYDWTASDVSMRTATFSLDKVLDPNQFSW